MVSLIQQPIVIDLPFIFALEISAGVTDCASNSFDILSEVGFNLGSAIPAFWAV